MNARKAASRNGLILLAAGAVAIATLAGQARAAKPDAPAPGTYALKDGTTLVVASNGWMRMFTAEGSRVNMKDGVNMETREGRLIVMKEDLNWKKLRQSGTLNPKFP
jgi:hypothetical protein